MTGDQTSPEPTERPQPSEGDRPGALGTTQRGPRRHGRTPGDLLIHPIAIVALVVVILNDRVLKVRYPSELSGKLSDFAGLVYFPLFVVACAEGVRWLARRRPWELTPRAVVIVSAVIGTAFVLIKTWPPAGDVYRIVIGAAVWPFEAAPSVIGGDGLPSVKRAGLVEDRLDLLALPVLVLPWLVARSVMGEHRPSPGNSARSPY